MMLKVAKLGIAIAAVLAWIVPAAYAGVPDVIRSFYVPQAGPVGATALEGAAAIALFRACPANDGGTTLPNNARIKVVVRDVNDNPIAAIAAADICILFNGGTLVQGFSGVGADSILANSVVNSNPLCPDVRCVQADDQTDATGTTYITFRGATVGNPGVAVRNVQRRWGHYDSDLPVFVLGFKLTGRLNTASATPAYNLFIKNVDLNLGLSLGPPPNSNNIGEIVDALDFSSVTSRFSQNYTTPLPFWADLNNSGSVDGIDLQIIVSHLNHGCATP